MEVENVIDGYRPSTEVRKLDRDGDFAYVDAYIGDIVQRSVGRSADGSAD